MLSGLRSAGCSSRLSACDSRLLINSMLPGRQDRPWRRKTAMPGNRHAPTNGLQMLQVDLPADDALTPGQTGGDLTPGVDQTAVTEGLATVGMGTALIGGKHIALGLYRPGTQQYLPVGGAGHRGKRRRNHDQLGPGVTQRLIQLGKAYIVTDAQPQPAHRGIDADDPV